MSDSKIPPDKVVLHHIAAPVRKALKVCGKSVAALLLAVLAAAVLFSVSPIYDFAEPKPFSGPDVFNPYAGFVDSLGWKRANFHTHTRVRGLLNECEYWPAHVDSCYRSFGYEIITFSNHNEITAHPYDPSLQVNVYEHGYGLFKFHKLVFGADKVWKFDHLLPFLASQRQFQMDRLAQGSDFIQLNHPFRTGCTTRHIMECLSGYRIIELDSGVTTEQDYWDWALSAGHYSFALANDDLHHPDASDLFAVRCNFLNCPDGRYESIRKTLLSGAYYCMRVPDYGAGDWTVKREMNRRLPSVTGIGSSADTLSLRLDRKAQRIVIYGRGHSILAEATGTDGLTYVMKPRDSYARFQAWFDDGAVIYTNAFARYDKARAAAPSAGSEHSVNLPLSILFNALLLAMFCGIVALFRLLFRHKKPL